MSTCLDTQYQNGARAALLEKVAQFNEFEWDIEKLDPKGRTRGALAGQAAATGIGLGGTGLALGGEALERRLTPKELRMGAGTIEKLRKAMNVPKEVAVARGAVDKALQSGFDPIRKKVLVPYRKVSPGILAHELGHASGKRMFGGTKLQMLSRGVGKLGAGLATLGQIYTDPESTATKILQYGPGVAMLPALGEELRASFRGLKGLKRLGGKGAMLRGLLSTVPAFATYAATAATPLLAGKAIHHYTGKDKGWLDKLFG